MCLPLHTERFPCAGDGLGGCANDFQAGDIIVYMHTCNICGGRAKASLLLWYSRFGGFLSTSYNFTNIDCMILLLYC